MLDREALEIIACLPKERTLYYYFKDRYAFALLHGVIGEGMSIAELKASPFAKLLARPAIKKLVADLGDGRLTPEKLYEAEPYDQECYVLTLGTWGSEDKRQWYRGYHQTSRRGVNLVLQLNFSTRHNRRYRELIEKFGRDPFSHDGHPNARRGYHTLAWARLDVDLKAGVALIEEIQTDWVRKARDGYEWLNDGSRRPITLSDGDAREMLYFRGEYLEVRRFERYVKEVLAPHINVWDEAMLSAALWFLKDELGIVSIYYHTPGSGKVLKGFGDYSVPPRSIYTQLPKRFCFHETVERPSLLSEDPDKKTRDLLKTPDLTFWQLPKAA